MRAFITTFSVLFVIACDAGESSAETTTGAGPPDSVVMGCLTSGDGFLKTRLLGSLEEDVNWPNSGTMCDGMARPDGSGARLTFSREIFEEGNRLVLVFGIDGITEGATGKAMPVNVTIIREGRGEFYGTMGGQVCEVDVTEHLALSNNDKALRPYRLEARGRCKGPVPAVAGDGEVRIEEFSYTGIVVWQDTPAEDEDKKVET